MDNQVCSRLIRTGLIRTGLIRNRAIVLALKPGCRGELWLRVWRLALPDIKCPPQANDSDSNGSQFQSAARLGSISQPSRITMDLPRSHLKISQLQAFVAVAQHGNFSTAALELGLSQSTVSHAIATLEAALGVILLARGRHGAALTAIGEQILPEAQQILELLGSIQTKASLDNGLQSGVVRIASVRSIATHLLPDAIVQFRRKFPLIHVVIRDCDHYVEVQQMLREGQAEIGITLMPISAEFEAWELIRDEFVLLLPADATRPTAPLTWEQIADLPMIMNPVAAPHIHTRTVQAHFAQFGHQLNVAYEVKEDSTIIGMVQRGLGATIMARLAAEPIPNSIQMQQLPVPLERKIGIVIRSDSLLPKAAFAFIDILKASH